MASSKIVYSMYIPRVASYYTEECIINTFENMGIGRVRRADFREIETETNYVSVFVHFTAIYDTDIATNIINMLGYRDNDNSCFKLYLNPHTSNQHWILLKNKNPVAETILNIHQVVENARILEERVAAQDEVIAQLNQDIEFLKNGVVFLRDYILTSSTTTPQTEEKSKELKAVLGIKGSCNGYYGN